jgi:hypothetical protein
MFEIRSHVTGTEVPVLVRFSDQVLEWFVGGESGGRYHVDGILGFEVDVDQHANVDLRVRLAGGRTATLGLPAEARPDLQLLIAGIERERV